MVPKTVEWHEGEFRFDLLKPFWPQECWDNHTGPWTGVFKEAPLAPSLLIILTDSVMEYLPNDNRFCRKNTCHVSSALIFTSSWGETGTSLLRAEKLFKAIFKQSHCPHKDAPKSTWQWFERKWIAEQGRYLNGESMCPTRNFGSPETRWKLGKHGSHLQFQHRGDGWHPQGKLTK